MKKRVKAGAMNEKKHCVADVIETYVTERLDKISATESTRKIAIALTREIRGEQFISGIKPSTIATGVIYIAGILSGQRFSQYYLSRELNGSMKEMIWYKPIVKFIQNINFDWNVRGGVE